MASLIGSRICRFVASFQCQIFASLPNLASFNLKNTQNNFFLSFLGENVKNNCKIRSMSVFSEQIRALDEIRKNFNKEFATLLI